jgi:heme/copper-type cytochrome/quinol oxidase subunit 3
MTRRARAVMNVSALPDVVFGVRDIMWWGTLGFMVIEGFTLVLTAVVYLYIQQNFATWPPEGTTNPSLGIPTAQLAVMLLSLPLMWWISRAAHAFELGKVRIGLTLASVIALVFVALRILSAIYSLHVKWDSNAYGSAQWLILGSHFTLLLIEFIEVAGMALLFWLAPVEEKHFSDAADMAFYWYFMVLSWVPLYVLCFLVPRWI